MADHEVILKKIPRLVIGKSDVIFDIRLGKDKLGSLRVSRGHIVWIPVNSEYGYWKNWGDFGDLLIKNGKRDKVKY
jgi:hypothetical protein